MNVRDAACRRYRAPLLDFVDHGEVGPGTSAALAHLDRCHACAEVIDATVLTIVALRRLGDEIAQVEPRADAWPRLRARVGGWRPSRISLLSPLAGMATTLAFAALLLNPTHPVGTASGPLVQLVLASSPNSVSADVHTNSVRRGLDPPGTSDFLTTRPGFKVIYPDGSRPTAKEVPEARSTVRPAESR